MNNVLIIQFAKWPQLGKVKTRLAKTIGESAALEAHHELTREVLNNLTSSGVGPVELWFDQQVKNTGGSSIVSCCENKRVAISLQQGKDLGERMFNAISQGLKDFEKVIIVGSDCPSVDKAYLQSAIKALDITDIVLGPAEDGGYVLIGASALKPTLLDDVIWGGGNVLASTIGNAKSLGSTYTLLDVKWDVDDYDDYQRWQRGRR